jgi:tryptophan synthase beta chain
VPPAIHAGGLRYHGMAPIICELQRLGIVEARAYHQNAVFEAAVQFARTEGIIPAPEPAHAIRAVIDEALACKQSGESKVILLALSGHGHFDMGAYDKYFAHELEDFAFPEEKMKEALTHLPQV